MLSLAGNTMDNTTKDQHFISQVEQRLNALNPAARPENQRIYEFKVVDREQHVVELTDVRGKSIVSSLSIFDLFSWGGGCGFDPTSGTVLADEGTVCMAKGPSSELP